MKNNKKIKASSIAVALLATVATTNVQAHAEQMTPVTKTENVSAFKVSEGLFMLQGKGGNIGVLIGEDGTFMIDDQYAPYTSEILDAVKAIGGSQPKFLLNTHFHGDHTGGNENLGKKEALIFSHDNVRTRIENGSFVAPFNMKTAPHAGKGLPVVTYSTDMTFHLNGDTIHSIHVPHAHTDGDSFIHFKSANVIHTGDLMFNHSFPFIDTAHGGTLKGVIDAANKMLTLANQKTKVIPGHGALSNTAELTAYRDMLQESYTRLLKLKNQGKNLEEVLKAKPLADIEKVWGKGFFTADKWITTIFEGIY